MAIENTNVEEVQEVTSEQDTGGEVEQVEKDARGMGWRPKNEWDGPAEKWIDAKTFVERGEDIMPILRANNKKMREELLTQTRELGTLKESLVAAQRAIVALRKGYNENTKQKVEDAIANLKEQFKQAREVGDVDTELKVKDSIDDLTAKAKKIGEEEGEEDPVDGQKKPDPAELSPEFKQWQSENKWFGNTVNQEDKARTEALIKIGENLRKEDTTLIGMPFMERCMEILKEKEEGYSRKSSKVESAGRGGGNSSSGRAFDKLPKEAKAVCHEDNGNFVGPGKMFKTVKEWEDHYANLYGE